MESVYLKQLVNVKPQGGLPDTNAPFSFLEWKERVPLVVEKDALQLYNSYVLDWFVRNKEKTISPKFVLRQKYLYMLDQLQLFFSEEEKNTWYSQVNLADEKELLLSIPYFAKKLKDIALYYLKLRRQLKTTKLKYNAVGTTSGLEHEIYRYLLETFSSNNNELSAAFYTTVPKFSALQTSLNVQVEELYDDKQYFDLSPTKPLSGYFDLLHDATSKFLLTKGIVLSSSDWLFNSFNIPVTSSFDSFIKELTGNLFETSDTILYGDFIQKYIAENKYEVSFFAELSTTSVYDVTLKAGNNYFYYPYGSTDRSTATTGQMSVETLSSLSIGDATAGTSLQDADVVFVKTGDEIKSAWLRYKQYEDSLKTVKADLKKDSTTSFIYPFPGYGLSGQNLPWTGSGFETNPEYNFLAKDLKAQVNQAYWSQELPADVCNVILLNNTTLVDNKATPNINPQFADQIFTRLERSTDTTLPLGELSGAWLYKFTKTALPISSNEPNVILWPYTLLDLAESYPDHLKQMSLENVCNPVQVQDVLKNSFVAASAFDNADKIYKLVNFNDTESDATECVWLSGVTIQENGYKYVQQDGFSALMSPGEAIRFIWSGPEADLDTVFSTVSHRKDCPFITNIPSVSAFEWQKCTCKQVYHTPFGHPQRLFQEGNSFADCIVKDTENNLNPFDFSSWVDSTGLPAISSSEFAWYKTATNHSWGDGRWVSNTLSSAPFKLQTGQAYFYKRTNSKSESDSFPSYTVKYSFGTNNTKWINAKLNADGTWGATVSSSLMVLYPGDILKYGRQANTVSYLMSSFMVENLPTNKGTVWSVYDSIPIVCGQNNSTTITWPYNTAPFGTALSDTQYPSTAFADITAIDAWSITLQQTGETQYISNVYNLTFVPPVTGTYSVAVTATTSGGQKVYESTRIPLITGIPQYTENFTDIEFSTATSSILIEHPLKGWNYNTNKPDSRANGARPYWAILDTLKDSTTRYKGVYSWGYSDKYVEEYLPNSNPIISPIEIKFGTILEYYRKGYSITWNQPITYKQFVGTKQWCQINSDTTQSSNLSSIYSIKRNPELIAIPTTTPSDILLSNVIDGAPVEIYYYAMNSFMWAISSIAKQDPADPSVTGAFITQTPWTTLTNRFYPTVANVPVVEETYSLEDVGGYFLPQHLGASTFINKDFDASYKTKELSGIFLAEDINIHIGGRGRTKQDQTTLYDWTENNQWLKESSTTGDLAGSIKKSLTKSLQTFIPYQSNSEETALGLVTPRSRLSPWGGTNDEEWTDVANEPKGFTGVRNVSAWVATQILKQNEKAIDRWTSDIYGNQYGLFKQLSGIPVAEHINTPGELWVRTNDQVVDPGYVSLSSVFESFKSIDIKHNTNVFGELTGNGVEDIDCYFNTLFIETNSAAIFATIDYNYDTATIESTFDNTRYHLLGNNLRFDKNWFFAADKKVISLLTEISGNRFYPALYELDLSTSGYKKVFPTSLTDVAKLTSSMEEIDFKTLSRGSIHFNNVLNSFLITYTGTTSADKMFIADFRIKNEDRMNLTKIDFYKDFFDSSIINEPPIVLTNYLSALNVDAGLFTVSVSAINEPTSYSLLNYTTEVAVITAGGYGVFTGNLSSGLHHINYVVSNAIGDSIYCLTLSAL